MFVADKNTLFPPNDALSQTIRLPLSCQLQWHYSHTIWKGNGMKLTANMDGIVIAAIALVMLSNLIHQLLA